MNKLNPKLFDKDVEQVPTRNGYGEGVLELGEKNKDVVVLTGDLKESTRVEEFSKRFSERFIECGVAEQNMMGIAAGLASAGKIPFVSSYAVFSPKKLGSTASISVLLQSKCKHCGSTYRSVSWSRRGDSPSVGGYCYYSSTAKYNSGCTM